MFFLKSKKIRKFLTFSIVSSITSFVLLSPIFSNIYKLNDIHNSVNNNQSKFDSNSGVENQNSKISKIDANFHKQLDLDFIPKNINLLPSVPLESLSSNNLSFKINNSKIDLLKFNSSIVKFTNGLDYLLDDDLNNFSMFFNIKNVDDANVSFADSNVTLNSVFNEPSELFVSKDYFSNRIKVFNPRAKTKISVDLNSIIPDSNTLPSDYLKQKNIEKKIKIYFNNSLPETIKNAKVSAIANDAAGTITFYVDPGVGIDASLKPIDLKQQEFVVKGFKTSKTSDKLKVEWAQTSFNGPFSASEFLNKYPLFKNQYMYPSVWYMQWGSQQFQDAVKKYIASKASLVPSSFNYENIFIKSVETNDNSGVLTISFLLNNYYDHHGIEQHEIPGDDDGVPPTPFVINIPGLKVLSSYPTKIQPEYTLPMDNHMYFKVYDQSFNEDIEKIAISLIQNSPVNFSLDSNRQYIDISLEPNVEGAYVDVTLNFQGYFDDRGTYNSSQYFSHTIRINGFKSSILTEINQDNLNLGTPDDIAQSAISNEYIIDNIVLKNNLIINPSPTFNPSNINISDVTFSNKDGELNFNISLSKYNNNNGVETDLGFVPVDLNITGFKKVLGKTRFNSLSYDIGSKDDVAYEYVKNPDKLIQLTETVLDNKVQDYSRTFPATELSILENSLSWNSEEGSITFTPVIKNYFDGDNFDFVASSKELQEIKITGFKRIGETRINMDANFVLGDQNILASTFFENNKEDLKKYIFDRTMYKPNDMTYNDIIINDNSTYSNLDGTITLYVTFKKWYDQNGQLMTTTSTNQNKVIISGYRRVSETSINDKLSVIQYGTLASEVVKDLPNLKILVINNLINDAVSNTTIDNVDLKNLTYNNLEGSISFQIGLNKYYDSRGNIYNGPDFKYFDDVVKITGYKLISPTQLPKNNQWQTDLTDKLAEKVSTDQNYLKRVVASKIIGSLPDSFNYQNDIIIRNLSFSNINGTITYDIDLNNYFNSKGEIVNGLQEVYTVNLYGFRTISPTTIQSSVEVTNFSNRLPSEFSKEDLVNIVYNNFISFYNNLPVEYFTKTNILIDDQISYYNSLGTIEIGLSTSTYFNESGDLVLNDKDNPLPFRRVSITGFNSISETIVNSGVVIPGLDATLPENVNNQSLVNIIFNNRNLIFSPLPTTFDQTSIQLINPDYIIRDNLSGTITLSLSIINYYNSLGLVEKSKPKVFNKIVLKGFKSTSQTVIDSEVHLPKSDVGNILASQMSNDLLKNTLTNNLSLFVRSAPSNFRIDSVEILQNSISNLIGSFIVKITFSNYYDEDGNFIQTQSTKDVRCYGFKTASPTIINSELHLDKGNELPSSENEETLLNIVWNNKEKIFENLPDGVQQQDITINVNQDSYINSEGQIYLKVNLYKYYNDSSNLVILNPSDSTSVPLSQDVVLTGYAKISPTTIKPKIIVNSLTLINKFATSVSATELEDYVFDNRQSIISSIPDGFKRNNISVSDLIYSNNTGTIIAKIKLSLFYDKNSQLSTTNFEDQTIIFEGFKLNNIVTYVEPTLFLNSSTIQSTPAHSVSYSKLLDYIFENDVIKNIPPSFSRSDLLPGSKSDFIDINNLEGYVTLKIYVKKYYDYQGNLINDQSNPLVRNITIYGFKKIQPTIVTSYYNSNSLSHILASDVADSDLLNIVRNSSASFIKNEPDFFNADTDILDLKIISRNNLDGTVSAILHINNYYDSFGNIISIDSNDKDQLLSLKTWNITFSGFKKLNPTYINSYYEIESMSNVLPSSVTNAQLKDNIFLNRSSIFINLPESGITKEDFDVEKINYQNKKGEITIKINLYKYVNNAGQLITKDDVGISKPLIQNVQIKGFASISTTTVINEISPIDLSDSIAKKLPTDITESDVTKFIIRNQDRIIFNSPVPLTNDNFSVNDIVSITPINKKGILKVKFKIRNYYNDLGELISNANDSNAKVFSIDLVNLQTVGETDVVNFYLVPSTPTDKTPQDLYNNNDYLKNLIFDNKAQIFYNLPPDFNKEDFTVSNQNFSNLSGTISLTISLTKFYDSDGNISNNQGEKTFQITLSGFRITQTTNFSPNISVVGYESIAPSQFYKENPDMAKFIFDNRSEIFSNLSTTPSFTQKSIKINSVLTYDYSGKIIVEYSITNYYDKNGILTQIPSENKTLTINGFLKTPITIIYNNPQTNLITIKPSIFIEQNGGNAINVIKTYIFNNQSMFFENLPTGENKISIDDILIDPNSIDVNDRYGQISFKISLNKYYNEYGVLVTTPSTPKEIVLSGFSKQSPTSLGKIDNYLSKNGGTIVANIGINFQTVGEFLSNGSPEEKITSLISSSIFNSNADENNGVLGFKSFNIDESNGTILVNDLRINNFFDAKTSELINVPDGVSFSLIIKGFRTTKNDDVSTPDIIIYVAIGISSAVILAIIIFFVYKFLRNKYFKI